LFSSEKPQCRQLSIEEKRQKNHATTIRLGPIENAEQHKTFLHVYYGWPSKVQTCDKWWVATEFENNHECVDLQVYRRSQSNARALMLNVLRGKLPMKLIAIHTSKNQSTKSETNLNVNVESFLGTRWTLTWRASQALVMLLYNVRKSKHPLNVESLFWNAERMRCDSPSLPQTISVPGWPAVEELLDNGAENETRRDPWMQAIMHVGYTLALPDEIHRQLDRLRNVLLSRRRKNQARVWSLTTKNSPDRIF